MRVIFILELSSGKRGSSISDAKRDKIGNWLEA